MKLSNRDCRAAVSNRLAFQANNIFGEWDHTVAVYTVYSYGYHWPLWVYVRSQDQWYGNDSRYSVTTSKHKSQSCPDATLTAHGIIYKPVADLKNLLAVLA